MKYSSEIIVNIPLKEFINKFNNPENLKHWQRGLVDYEHIHGIPSEIGSKIKLFYKMGSRKVELIETVTFNDIPHALHVAYDTKGMHNIQENFFERITEAAHTGKGNLLELSVEAAQKRASLGEISYAMEKEAGRYKAVIRSISGIYSSIAYLIGRFSRMFIFMSLSVVLVTDNVKSINSPGENDSFAVATASLSETIDYIMSCPEVIE